jgi:murein DD-endopeptidase MepM/ murein hydrolase activator NlpD
LREPGAAGWGDGHSGYSATDIFAACGAEIVAPVNGELTEVRTVDSWDPNVDNPATRGGRSITIVGDDGVRYYLAHLDEVDPGRLVGTRVAPGDRLGTVGVTGRTSACHVHFGISPPCPGKEWSVRRGAIPPRPYLDAWRDGRPVNPVVEVLAWVAANPDACEQAMADPFAADS